MPLWNAAVQHGAVKLTPTLTHELESLGALDAKADANCRDIVLALRSFADGADSFVSGLGKDGNYLPRRARGRLSQAKSVRARKDEERAQQKFEGLLGELDGVEKLGLRAEQIKVGLTESRGETLQKRKYILLTEAEKKANEAANGDDVGADGSENDDETIEEKHIREAKELHDKIEKDEEAKVAQLEKEMKAKAAAALQSAEAAARDEQAALEHELADKNLSEKTAEKLRDQYNRDKEHMAKLLDGGAGKASRAYAQQVGGKKGEEEEEAPEAAR